MQKSLIINSTDVNGNAKAKSITNINPDATSEQLQEFAQRVTALTTNTYEGASVVQKYDVTEAVGGGVVGGLLPQEISIEWITGFEYRINRLGTGQVLVLCANSGSWVVHEVDSNGGFVCRDSTTYFDVIVKSDGVYATTWAEDIPVEGLPVGPEPTDPTDTATVTPD